MRHTLKTSSDLLGAIRNADAMRRYMQASYDLDYDCASVSGFEMDETIEIMNEVNMNDLDAGIESDDGFDLIDPLDQI